SLAYRYPRGMRFAIPLPSYPGRAVCSPKFQTDPLPSLDTNLFLPDNPPIAFRRITDGCGPQNQSQRTELDGRCGRRHPVALRPFERNEPAGTAFWVRSGTVRFLFGAGEWC